MKGTIDQVEAFFSGIGGLWGRMLSFLGTCWFSFAFAVICMSATWSWSRGFSLGGDFGDWYLLPVMWVGSILAACFNWWWWWGIPHIIYLAGALYAVLVVETNLFRSMLVLFAVECLHLQLLMLFNRGFDLADLFDLEGEWHPLLPFVILMQAYAIWQAWRSWRDERRVEMPP